jgi:hypothetical protein
MKYWEGGRLLLEGNLSKAEIARRQGRQLQRYQSVGAANKITGVKARGANSRQSPLWHHLLLSFFGHARLGVKRLT